MFHMKQLKQDIFDGVDGKYTAASIDQNGGVWVITGNKNDFECTEENQLSWNHPVRGDYIKSGYDTTNWKTSSIDREVL